jgi:hypothetical protein
MEMEVNLLQNYLLQLLQFARAGRVDGALVKLQKGEGEREGSDEGGGGGSYVCGVRKHIHLVAGI